MCLPFHRQNSHRHVIWLKNLVQTCTRQHKAIVITHIFSSHVSLFFLTAALFLRKRTIFLWIVAGFSLVKIKFFRFFWLNFHIISSNLWYISRYFLIDQYELLLAFVIITVFGQNDYDVMRIYFVVLFWVITPNFMTEAFSNDVYKKIIFLKIWVIFGFKNRSWAYCLGPQQIFAWNFARMLLIKFVKSQKLRRLYCKHRRSYLKRILKDRKCSTLPEK